MLSLLPHALGPGGNPVVLAARKSDNRPMLPFIPMAPVALLPVAVVVGRSRRGPVHRTKEHGLGSGPS